MNELTIVIIIILFILIISVIAKYNRMVSYRQKVLQSKSNIDVFLKKRFDLIPNLERVVKGYQEYEKETLEHITKLRTEYEQNRDIHIANELNKQMVTLLATVENNPILKSSELFLNFQKELSNVEDEIQAVRRIYNNSVTEYNTLIQKIPYNILNKVLKFKKEELLQFDSKFVNIKF